MESSFFFFFHFFFFISFSWISGSIHFLGQFFMRVRFSRIYSNFWFDEWTRPDSRSYLSRYTILYWTRSRRWEVLYYYFVDLFLVVCIISVVDSIHILRRTVKMCRYIIWYDKNWPVAAKFKNEIIYSHFNRHSACVCGLCEQTFIEMYHSMANMACILHQFDFVY